MSGTKLARVRRPKRRNVAETAFEESMREKRWQYTKRGWPDYFVWRANGDFAVVEVKPHNNFGMKPSQRHIIARLIAKGVPCYVYTPDRGFRQVYEVKPEPCIEHESLNHSLVDTAWAMLQVLKGMNHMGGDERGGYCICPRNDGSAPDEQHSTNCSDARQVIARAEGGSSN